MYRLYWLLVNYSYLSKIRSRKLRTYDILTTFFKLGLLDLLFEGTRKKVRNNILGFKAVNFSHHLAFFLFSEIFIRNEYYFVTDKFNPLIIDAGANVGMATLYFCHLFPEGKVIAIEPDPEAFTLLKENININKLQNNVQAHNCAIGSDNQPLEFYKNDATPGSLRMSLTKREAAKHKIVVEGKKLSNLLSQFPDKEVDFLKIDVEGAEEGVLQDLIQSGAIKKVKKMVIEYHHRIDGAKSKLSEFLGTLEQNGFEYQLDVRHTPIYKQEAFQDIIINAYVRTT